MRRIFDTCSPPKQMRLSETVHQGRDHTSDAHDYAHDNHEKRDERRRTPGPTMAPMTLESSRDTQRTRTAQAAEKTGTTHFRKRWNATRCFAAALRVCLPSVKPYVSSVGKYQLLRAGPLSYMWNAIDVIKYAC